MSIPFVVEKQQQQVLLRSTIVLESSVLFFKSGLDYR